MNSNTPFVANKSGSVVSTNIPAVEELTINWHVTEACNYGCQYCYAKWTSRPNPRELFHDPVRTRSLLTELFRFFHPGNRSNPLRKQLSWKTLRLNLAGGEPSILGDRLLEIVHAARGVGFRVSIISNGSRLTPLAIKQLAPHLTCLGISLDSAVPATNRKIGRVDGKGRLLDIKELVENLQLARQINPQLAVKLNTVVNRRNSREDLCQLADQIRPDRWKILRMLPVMDHSLAVSKEEFSAFVQRHRDFETIQCVEDNHDMCESYLMVDPFGRFFQNQPSLNQAYVYSKPVLSAGAERAFSELAFNTDSFQSRYMGDVAGGNQ